MEKSKIPTPDHDGKVKHTGMPVKEGMIRKGTVTIIKDIKPVLNPNGADAK